MIKEKTKNRNSGVRETVKKERKIEIVGMRKTVKMVQKRRENGKSGEGNQERCDKGGNKRIDW